MRKETTNVLVLLKVFEKIFDEICAMQHFVRGNVCHSVSRDRHLGCL